MDRNEAYETLSMELGAIANKSKESLIEITGQSIELETPSKTGVLYSVTINVERKEENAFVIEGNIHDNSAFKFELLEEKMEVEK